MTHMTLLMTALLPLYAGQNPPAPARPEGDSGRVLVKIEDAKLSDANRALLALVLAKEVPEPDWGKVPVKASDNVETIVDRYYDVYRKSSLEKYSLALPKTTDALMRLINDANPDAAAQFKTGGELRIPPVPVRPKSGELGDAVRTYDPASLNYAWRSEASGWLFASQGQPKSARVQNQIRTAGATIIEMSKEGAAAVAGLITASRQIRFVKVQLHAAPCAAADPALDGSPYLAAAKARVAHNLAAVKAAAAKRRLALLDFDFRAGHGARVQAAAAWVLSKLGAVDLVPLIEPVEMNKAVNAGDLTSALVEYDRFAGTIKESDDFSFAEATMWLLRHPSNQSSNAVYEMPAMAVSAPLWKYMSKPDWVSLSWEVDSWTSVQPARLNDLLNKDAVFVTVSAGNAGEVRADLFPQSGASIFPHFVNVTYGDADGTVRGSRTSLTGGGKVDILAPGCGIAFKPLGVADGGSSYAAPVVAASAWLRSLLDNTLPSKMRTALYDAVLLTPPPVPGVTVSGGVFDPARLIAPPSMHYLDPSRRQLTTLLDAKLDAGTCGMYQPFKDARGYQDFLVYARSTRYFLARRYRTAQFPGIRLEDPCELSTLTFAATTTAGAAITLTSPADFIKAIGHLTF